MNLNREQFLRAVERGQALFDGLKRDYPELKLMPVFSRFGPRSGQCDLTTDLKKIVMEFPEMLAGEDFNRKGMQRWNETSRVRPRSRVQLGSRGGRVQEEESFSHKKAQESTKMLRSLLKAIKRAENENENETAAHLRNEAAAVEKALLDPELDLYCGDVLIEYRPGELKYEPLRRLQQDPRLPPGLNTVGSIRVIAGSLEFLQRNERSVEYE